MGRIERVGTLGSLTGRTERVGKLHYYLLLMPSKRVVGAYERVGSGALEESELQPDGHVRTVRII
jgi:hypothetical protein